MRRLALASLAAAPLLKRRRPAACQTPLTEVEARRVLQLFDGLLFDEEYGDIHLYDISVEEEQQVEGSGGDATYGELREEILEWLLAHCEMRPQDILCDLGSGSGRALLYLALRTGLPAVGVELSPTRHRCAETLKMLAQPFLCGEVTFVQGDLSETGPQRHATVVLFANKLFSEDFSSRALRLLPRRRALLCLRADGAADAELAQRAALGTTWRCTGSRKQPVWLYTRAPVE
ncbi:unnamed protein product [Effrenium voratum]|nr:unnamed protein product [Effrenium voratum]